MRDIARLEVFTVVNISVEYLNVKRLRDKTSPISTPNSPSGCAFRSHK
jgi:hypothetical protein